MGYPTEQRFKILQQQYQDAEQIAAPAPTNRPQAIPGLIIDFIARTDVGYCLKVIPFAPKNVTTAGELTFIDGSNPVPSNAGSMYYVKVYPVDVKPADVQGAYQVGQTVMVYPYWGGKSNDDVKGTYICVQGSATLPSGEIQFQVFQMGSTNQPDWDFVRAHSMVS